MKAQKDIEKSDLFSFEDVKKLGEDKSEWLAIGDNGKEYNATYTTKYGGVMFFCIPSHIKVIGYLKIV